MKKIILAVLFLAAAAPVFAADTYTTHYSFRKPALDVEDEVTPWGQKYNDTFDLVDAAVWAVATSTGVEPVTALKVSTGVIQVQLDAVAVSTGLNTVAIAAIKISTGMLSSSTETIKASLDAVILSTGAIAVSTGAIKASLDAVILSTGAIAVSTGAIKASLDAVILSTGAIAVSTGALETSKLNLAGGTMTGQLNTTTTTVVSMLVIGTYPNVSTFTSTGQLQMGGRTQAIAFLPVTQSSTSDTAISWNIALTTVCVSTITITEFGNRYNSFWGETQIIVSGPATTITKLIKRNTVIVDSVKTTIAVDGNLPIPIMAFNDISVAGSNTYSICYFSTAGTATITHYAWRVQEE